MSATGREIKGCSMSWRPWAGIASPFGECQLKKGVREQTLESLAFTLNHIFLQDRTVKPYGCPEEQLPMAAEEQSTMAAEERPIN